MNYIESRLAPEVKLHAEGRLTSFGVQASGEVEENYIELREWGSDIIRKYQISKRDRDVFYKLSSVFLEHAVKGESQPYLKVFEISQKNKVIQYEYFTVDVEPKISPYQSSDQVVGEVFPIQDIVVDSRIFKLRRVTEFLGHIALSEYVIKRLVHLMAAMNEWGLADVLRLVFDFVLPVLSILVNRLF